MSHKNAYYNIGKSKLIQIGDMNREEAWQLKWGVVKIHKMLELIKLHINRQENGVMRGVCKSFCHELGLQKQTRNFVNKHKF